MLARILRTISYSPTGLSIMVESMERLPFLSFVTLQPRSVSSLLKTAMSARFGVDLSIEVPGARMVAAIIGREAFFEPFMLTEPLSLTGPSI